MIDTTKWEERHHQSLEDTVSQNRGKERFTMKIQSISCLIGFLLLVLFLTPNIAAAESFKNIHNGSEGERVEWLQAELVERGYLNKEEQTNIYDESTLVAVKKFQEESGLLADGVAGVQTVGALKILAEGSEGPLVYELQSKLAHLEFYKDEVNGFFGPTTKEAVVAFQQFYGLLVDGIAGPQTHQQLYYNHVQTKPVAQQQSETLQPTPDNEEVDKETTQPQQQKQQGNSSETETSAPTTTEANELEDNSTSSEEVQIEQTGKTYQMEATAYTAYCNGCSGVTRTGIDLRANPNQKVVAVDPNVIPLGSRVYVEGYGEAVAGDTGGAIKGHKIDLFVQTKDEAYTFGRQQVTVTVLE